VRNEQAIGSILECPKCSSMVLVVPPKGWRSPSAPAAPATAEAAPVPSKPVKHAKPSAASPPAPPIASKKVAAAAVSVPPPPPPPQPPAPPPLPPQKVIPPAGDHPAFGNEYPAFAAPPPPPPPPVSPPPKIAAPPIRTAQPNRAVQTNADPEPLRPIPPPVVRAGWLWHEWLLLVGAPLLGIAVVVGAWLAFYSPRSNPTPPDEAADSQTAQSPAEDGKPAEDAQIEPAAVAIDRRWLPDRTAMLLSCRGSELSLEPNLGTLIDRDQLWEKNLAAILENLNLKVEQIQRATWAAVDPSVWPKQSVVIIELQKSRTADALASIGESAGFNLNDVECRRLRGGAWADPFAAVDRRTIVAGDEKLLRHLATRGEARLESPQLDKLLSAMPPEADAMLLVDLAAARKAQWQLPGKLLDVWTAGKQSWHVLWDLPAAAGFSLRYSDRVNAELALVCDSDSASERARLAVDQLIPAAKTALNAQVDSLAEKLRAGLYTASVAEQYEQLLKQSLGAMQTARCEIAQGIVWAKFQWSETPAALAALANEARPAVSADWYAAVEQIDRGNHIRLLGGLVGYQKSEGQFPVGAAGGVLLPPETRLSWIAAMLPYLGHADWHRKLQSGDSWNGTQNRPVTHQVLPEVINPVLGPDQTPAGFGVTHYVGVAGVGADAGNLKIDDPRAGVFGYGRSARAEDMTRGASNTLALLGVVKQIGPWGQGGGSTVRPLTQAPYVNGPDGFGSGQSDGMLAGMADGSVHFVSNNVDPRVLEQLAVLHGNEDLNAAKLLAKPIAPKPKPPEPKAAGDGGEKPGGAKLDAAAIIKGAGEKPAAKSKAKQAEIAAKLAFPIPAIEINDMPLSGAVRILSGICGVPISFDPDTLADLQVSLSDPITVKLTRATVEKALDNILSSRGLTYVVENGYVLITAPPEHREKLVSKKYTVSDLAENGGAISDLCTMILTMVKPDSWQVAGGRGTIQAQEGVLTILQSEEVHCRVVLFCEKLRAARNLPLKSRLDPDLCSLVTRLDRAQEWLEAPITINFSKPAPLKDILAYLEETLEINVLVDRPELSAAGIADSVEASWKAEKKPLSAALMDLLQPLNLSYRVIDGETLQVSTRQALDSRMEVEFYRVGEAAKGQAAALMERIRNRAAPSSWNDAGGPGLLYFDKPSGCLIVSQSQGVQKAVRQLLAEKGS
jgi:hypothetical protein